MPKQVAVPKSGKRTVQMDDFAVQVLNTIRKPMRETQTMASAAAVLAFADLSREKQLDYVRAAREKVMAAPVPQPAGS